MQKLFSLLSILALTGCATVTSESYQKINVTTVPDGAECTLSNDAGTYSIESTPATVRVTRSFSPLKIHCTKEQAGRDNAVIEARTRGRAYGNLLLLGLPAMVDAASGEGYEYEPADISITLK